MTTELIGYADKMSVSPGQTVGFHVSTDFPEYNISMVRLIRGDRTGQGLREEEVNAIPARRGRKQVAHPGSYAIVEDHPALNGLRNFTVQMWIFPTTPVKRADQGLLSRWSEASGFSLVIGSNGQLGIWLSDETGVERIYSGKRLVSRVWCFVCASVDTQAHTVVLKQTPLANMAFGETASAIERSVQSKGPYDSHSSLLIAATSLVDVSPDRAAAAGLYNGKIDRPALFGRALDRAEIQRLERGESPSEVGGRDVIGAWDFSKGISTASISDIGHHGLNGAVVNMPTRAVTDHLWNGEAHDHKHAPSQYSAIHFHDDD